MPITSEIIAIDNEARKNWSVKYVVQKDSIHRNGRYLKQTNYLLLRLTDLKIIE